MIIIKARTDYGANLEGIYIPGHKVYGIVDYTPKNGAVYNIEIYGGKGSVCENELLKTMLLNNFTNAISQAENVYSTKNDAINMHKKGEIGHKIAEKQTI